MSFQAIILLPPSKVTYFKLLHTQSMGAYSSFINANIRKIHFGNNFSLHFFFSLNPFFKWVNPHLEDKASANKQLHMHPWIKCTENPTNLSPVDSEGSIIFMHWTCIYLSVKSSIRKWVPLNIKRQLLCSCTYSFFLSMEICLYKSLHF